MRVKRTHRFSHRFTAALLCLCMIIPMMSGLSLLLEADAAGSSSGPTSGVTRQADPSTMDTYKDMLNFSENTRYAGRLWSDKSVYAYGYNDNSDPNWNNNVLTLNAADDGVTGSVELDEDFLHVYSVLGSSIEFTGVPPVRVVIVFDNSASMYNSYKGNVDTSKGETLWSRQRIALTVEAINRAIDALMEASEYNEVSVVLFGDGAKTGTEGTDTFRYHGQSTAVTILPMKHYEPLSVGDAGRQGVDTDKGDKGYTPYLSAGWNNGTPIDGANPQQSDTSTHSGGWVFVNNEICKLKKTETTDSDNPGHKWYDESSWNGWNGCEDNKYTAYANGTTDIQAGYYVGMQELLKANKTEKVGNQVYECVPSLVMLTDGQTTDMLTGNFVTPEFSVNDDKNSEPTSRGFVNDTGNKLRSFTGATGKKDKEIGNFWDMFVEVAEDEDNVKKYQSAAWENTNKDEDGYVQGAPTGAGLTAMENVAKNYSDSIAAMVLGTLMTTAYYKEEVGREYNVDGDWSIYTISVDMVQTETIPNGAAKRAIDKDDTAPTDELPTKWEYDITSNPATMDPSTYFYTYDEEQNEWKLDLGWLFDKGYINSDSDSETAITRATFEADLAAGKDIDVTGKTAYPDWSVGEMLIQGIVTAATTLEKWETAEADLKLTFRPWKETTGILSKGTDGKPSYKNTEREDLRDVVWNADRYVNPWGHGNGYLLQAVQEVSIPVLKSGDTNNPYDLTAADVMANIAYNEYAYYPKTATGSAQDLANAFVEIIEAITEPLFRPVGGTNDLGVDNSVTYMDPVGKYMDVKDVKSLVLFGKQYDITETAVYDYQWNDQYITAMSQAGYSQYVPGTSPLPEGWYRGEPTATAQYSKDVPEDSGTAEKAWADGWVYRVNYQTAAKFVPTLGDINNPNMAEAKERQTEYTFYRIDGYTNGERLDAAARNKLHMNPAYGTDNDIPGNVVYDAENQAHLKTPGVYALSDLRIWVEDSGDFSDDNTHTLTDTNFDEALWINIPVNMVPLRTVSIDLGATGKTGTEWKYRRNTDEGDSAYSASFPLRVFYTVGVSDEVLENGRVNIAGAISPEYILQNKVTTEAAESARNLDVGDLEFFSNWYNPLKRYSDYVTTRNDYTYGDPVTSFSPSEDNRYYSFEKALPLYDTAYVYVKNEESPDPDDSQWRRVVIGEDLTGNEDVRTFDANNFGGKLIAQDLEVEAPTSAADATTKINAALEKLTDSPTPKHGDMVLLKTNILDNVTKPDNGVDDPFASDSYYFLPIEYYELGEDNMATMTKNVITRKGSEFGSAYTTAKISNGDMLVWHDITGTVAQDYPYLSYTETGDSSRGRDYIGTTIDPATGWYQGCDKSNPYSLPATKPNERGTYFPDSEWVVCAKPGGLRVGDLAQAVQSKAGAYSSTAEQDTIKNYYIARYEGDTSVGDKGWGYYAQNVTRTANNYYLPTISSSSGAEAHNAVVNVYLGNNGRLYLPDTTLLVTKLIDPPKGCKIDEEEEFNYQIYIAGITGPMDAVVIRYNTTRKAWQRQFHYIDLELDKQLFLQTQNGDKAMVDKNGKQVVYDSTSGNYVYAGTNIEYAGTRYYVYIGRNRGTTETGVADTAFRVYHNEKVDGVGSVDKEDVTIEGTSGSKGTFKATTVWLVSESRYTSEWVPEGGPQLDPTAADFSIATHSDETVSGFELLTIDPNASTDTTEISISTPYLTASSYWTKTVTFGENANKDGDGKDVSHTPMEVVDLYDPIIPSSDRSDYFPASVTTEDIAQHTAEFTLRHGEALLFSGIPSNSVYRVTEKLTDEQIKAGYTLKEVSHNQQVGSVSTYRPGAQSIPVYYKEGTTYLEYGGGAYPEAYNTDKTEKGLMWAVDQNGNPNTDTSALHYEPFFHTNAMVWEAYSTMDATARGDNHHQPTTVQDGTSTFWLWNGSESENTGMTHTVQDNPSCKSLKEGGCDEAIPDSNQVRHYFFKDGAMRDFHYQGEGSGYIRNVGRFITSPTVHFLVDGEEQDMAETTGPKTKSNTDYVGVYSVFGNTGTFEESANFVNTIQNDKTETQINGENVTASKEDRNTYPGVQTGDEITYEVKWANTTGSEARVVIIDPLDDGVDFVSATDGGRIFEKQTDANAYLATIYTDTKNPVEVDSGHVVIWDLGVKAASTNGSVTLTVKVNENAAEWWDYDGDGVADAPVGSTNPDDYMVRNRATVRVADNAYNTNTVVNPVGQPDKTETYIERGANAGDIDDESVTDDDLTLGGDGKYHGPLVFVGDKITYEISWRNYESEAATVTIRDPLDKNVKFVSASFEPATFEDSKGQPLSTTLGLQSLSAGVTNATVKTSDTVEGYGEDGTETRETIIYNSAHEPANSHSVIYNLGKMPAGSSGTVTLIVEVLDTATPVGYVDNTAFVQVGSNHEQRTRTLENPTPHEEKREVTPGDGVMVQVGDEITYEIDWQNYKPQAARVIIMDTLDPGVDFVSADNGGKYYREGGEVPAVSAELPAVSIPEHTVVWVLDNRASNDTGTVALTVKVNENAKVGYSYNDDSTALTPNTSGKDYEVLNQARVKVDNDAFVKTRIVENPVPEKTETQVNHAAPNLATESDPTLTPNQNTENTYPTYTGPVVYVGDRITYTVHWTNGHDEPATVTIVDPLDPGVDFVRASFGSTTLTSGGADNTVTNGNITITYDPDTHTVTWTLEGRPAGAGDIVTLVVEVNEKATPAGIVDNQAIVQVGNDARKFTEVIENPTPNIDKAEITPGEGMQVTPGDEIDYKISWRNYESTEADVIITDKLDPGVDFVSAWVEGHEDQKITSGSTQEPTEANLVIILKGSEGVTAGQKFTFTLDLTAQGGKELSATGYDWKISETETGKWTTTEKTLALRPGDTLTLSGLPVGTTYTLTPDGKDPVVSDAKIGLYGSAVTVTATAQTQTASLPAEVQQIPTFSQVTTPSEPTPNEPAPTEPTPTETTPDNTEQSGTEPDETLPDNGTTIPGEYEIMPISETGSGIDLSAPSADESSDGSTTGEGTTGNEPTSSEQNGGTAGEPAQSGGEPEADDTNGGEPDIVYTFTATVEDLPDPAAAGGIMTMALTGSSDSGFNPTDHTLNDEEPTIEHKFTDTDGKTVGMYYYAKAHTVVWVLEGRAAGAEGKVNLKVRVNEDAEKFWSYDDPTLGPSDTDTDYRVRNRAGVQVGNNPEVKTRIIENPTEPEKTETHVNDTDVSRDLIAGENGYVAPQVNVGDTITYRITWQNNAKGDNGELVPAEITITDVLDPNVEFVEASMNPDVGSCSYDSATHTVTWNLGVQQPRATGFVTLTVRVLPGALTPGEVENQATVSVNNDHQQTSRVENPVVDTVSLTVTKTVTGTAGDVNKDWHFTVTLDKPLTGQYGEMEFNAGVAEFTLRHRESITATGLPVGIGYTVTEAEANADGYTTTVPTNASGTITGGTAEVEFENSKDIPTPENNHGHLTVTKTVTGAAGDTSRLWHFTVTLTGTATDGITTAASVNGPYGGMNFTNGVAEFTLRHDQSATALNLPAGLGYTVTETEANEDGYTTSSQGETGEIPNNDTASATFENSKNPPPPPPGNNLGNLTVTKTVTGDEGDTAKEWHFTVTLGSRLNGRYGDMTFTGGVAEFTLKHGESKTARNLPAGITYTVTETEANEDGYTTTSTGDSGTIPNGGTARAAFVNGKNPPPPEDDSGNLTVTKTVTGNAGDTTKEWHFTVTLDDTGVNGAYGDMTFTNGVAAFTLKHGESRTATGLPAGVTYTVTEQEANEDGYTTTASGVSGTITDGGTGYASFVNDRNEETPPPPTTPDNPPDSPTPGSPTPGSPTPGSPTPDNPPHNPPTNPPDNPSEPPKTGESNMFGLWTALTVISLAGAAITSVSLVRSRRSDSDRRAKK